MFWTTALLLFFFQVDFEGAVVEEDFEAVTVGAAEDLAVVEEDLVDVVEEVSGEAEEAVVVVDVDSEVGPFSPSSII